MNDDSNKPIKRIVIFRRNHGSNSPLAKINEDDVREMRILRKAGSTLKELALKYKLSSTTISSICTRNSWRHVE